MSHANNAVRSRTMLAMVVFRDDTECAANSVIGDNARLAAGRMLNKVLRVTQGASDVIDDLARATLVVP